MRRGRVEAARLVPEKWHSLTADGLQRRRTSDGMQVVNCRGYQCGALAAVAARDRQPVQAQQSDSSSACKLQL